MTRLATLLVAFGLLSFVVSPSSGATRRSYESSIATPGLVTKVAADGQRVAVMTTKIKGACGKVVVWNTRRAKTTSFKTSEGCPHADVAVIPFAVDQLALGDGQVAWAGSTGGNETEVLVYAASLATGKAKEVDFRTHDSTSGEGDDAQRLLGGGSVLAYDRLLDCVEDSNGGFSCDVRLVRIHGLHATTIARGQTLAAVGGARLAVTSTAGVALLRADGSQVASVADSVTPGASFAAGSTRLAVASSRTLDVYDAVSGAKLGSIPLGTAASLELIGVNTRLALLRGRGSTALVRLSDSKRVSLSLKGIVDARLTEAGLFYAYNTPAAARKGHVVFEPTAKLLARF
jgi:hypothetical protein